MTRVLSGAILLLQPVMGTTEAFAFDVSLGNLICSVQGKAEPEDGAPGPVYLVTCAFQNENGGAVAQYVGTLVLQPQAAAAGRSFIWIVRGPRSLAAEMGPGDLAHTYTAGGAITAGTMAPLVPKDGDDRTLGLFTLGEPVVRDVTVGGARRPARSDPVATLDLKLTGAPV